MVNQVQTVSILMIVQGTLASLMGLFYLLMGPTLMFFLTKIPPAPASTSGSPAPPPTGLFALIGVVYIALGSLALLGGVVNVVAGIRTLRFRNRGLAIAALVMNVLPAFTMYCAPTAIGLMVFGFIVFLNSDVVKAFELANEGWQPEQIRERFAARSRYPDDREPYPDRLPPSHRDEDRPAHGDEHVRPGPDV